MHTKKTNNTNKLMQTSDCFYKKNQKLQNFKKKKKKKLFFFVPSGIAWNQPVWPIRLVFKPVRNVGISIPVYVPVQYIPTCTGTVSTTLLIVSCWTSVVQRTFEKLFTTRRTLKGDEIFNHVKAFSSKVI